MVIVIDKARFIVESGSWCLLPLPEFCLPELLADFASWITLSSKISR
jgi:hypothetical protein